MVGKISEMSQINFEDMPQSKKGAIGEEIVRNLLRNKGWITYNPDKGKAHYFDILATKDKKKVIAIDVKTKARFNNWPAQGINLRHYNEYIEFVKDTNVEFYLIFVDDKNGDIHLANLINLKEPFYPCNGIIAWSLDQMIKIACINSQELLDKMSQFDTRNYEYDPNDVT